MEQKKILVTGSNGQLGKEIKDLGPLYPQYEFIFLSHNELSIDDKDALAHLFQLHQPQYVINCAAYTAVDKAEEERNLANKINGYAVGTLAAQCKKYNTRLVHVSTDYVFNGESDQPLRESDAVDPVNAYGESKLLGEKLAQENDPEVVIIRTSWVYSYYGKNFVKTMIRLMKEKASIGVVRDQVGSPTYAADLAEAIMQIINSGKWVPGIYNYSNDGVISWYEFAVAIRENLSSSCLVNPLASAQFPTPAKRPKYSVLNKEKIEGTYNIPIKNWRNSLDKCMQKLTSIEGTL